MIVSKISNALKCITKWRPAWHFSGFKSQNLRREPPCDCASIVKEKLNFFWLHVRVARSQVLFMPLILILCSFFYSEYHYEIASCKSFIYVAISILLYNLSVNTISEYRDCRKGIDDLHSPGTKYRLVSEIVPKKNVLIIGIIAFLVASISGVVAVCFGPYTLIVPGLIAAGITIFYSEWPLGLKYKALGEACVFVVYGPLVFSSCILALANQFSINDLLFSVPFGIFTTNVVLANNIRDYEFEKGRTVTLPIKFGLKTAYFTLFFITHLAFLMIPFLVYRGIIPNICFISFLAYPLIFLSVKKIGKPEFINIFGIMQITFTLLICLSFLVVR